MEQLTSFLKNIKLYVLVSGIITDLNLPIDFLFSLYQALSISIAETFDSLKERLNHYQLEVSKLNILAGSQGHSKEKIRDVIRLNLSRRTSFGLLHKITYCYMGWNQYKQVQMFCRNQSIYNLNAHLLCHSSNNIADMYSNSTSQNTVTILCYLYQMVSMMIYCMRSMAVNCHPYNITKVSPI